MKTGKVRIISISDSHLGNRNVPVDQMVDGYKLMFLKLENPDDIDFIIHGGDFFDMGLSLASADVIVIQTFIRWLLLFCRKHDIKLRVLEGTPSHDRKQSKQFVVINDSFGAKKVDLKYIDTLSIVHEEEYGLDFLYVPDEIRSNCEETYLDTLSLLAERGIDKVHFAIMHGNFKYQIPAIAHLDAHVEKNYLDIVKYLIFIGHVHLMSIYERIRAQGSTDRISHGEEDDKGMFDSTIVFGDKPVFNEKFIVNDNAAVFKTIDLRSKTVEEAVKLVNENISVLESGNLRLHIPDDEVLKGLFNDYRKAYPNFKWTVKVEKAKNRVTDDKSKITDFETLTLNSETINKHVSDRLIKNGIDPSNLSTVMELLEECKE